MIVAARETFNLNKSEGIEDGINGLKDLAEKGETAKKARDDCKQKIIDLEKEISELKLIKPLDIYYVSDTEEIKNLKKEISELNSQEDKKELPIEFKDSLEIAKHELKEAQETEAAIKAVEGSKERIHELTCQKKDLSDEFNNLEKILHLIDEYNREIANQTETIVNEMFDGNVTFRMFTLQENGSLNPTCDIMMVGKPFDTALSTGEKIQAGLYIIKTMSKYFKLWATVFIENAESVSIIPKMDCQTIELHHDRNVKTLTQED